MMAEPILTEEIIFESELGTGHPAYLADYQHVQERVALPITVFLEMVLAAAQTALPPGPYHLAQVAFKQVLLLTEETPRTIRLVLAPEPAGGATFRILSPTDNQDGPDSRWTLYAEGVIVKTTADQLPRMMSHAVSPKRSAREHLKWSLFYFGSSEAAYTRDRYDLLLDGARFADENGFTAIWTPERHFHQFGGSYPSPAVLSAALATITRHVHLRAGSVILPLHHPLRIAEEWSVIDNLSRGRVGLSFATGWNADDFVLAPENYEDRKERLWRGIQLVQQFWRGETVLLPSGSGKTAGVSLFPLPMQSELPTWVTIVKNPETYRKAGAIGAHVLTNLLGQTMEELEENITLYRNARAQHGHDPDAGEVTLLLHTFVGEEVEQVRRLVREPFRDYLKSTVGIIRNLVKSLDLRLDLDALTPADLDSLLSFAFERYFQTASLMGTPQTCRETVERLRQIGVSEIGCFVDFGVDSASVRASFPQLKRLQESTTGDRKEPRPAASPRDAIAVIRERCDKELAATEHYQALSACGIQLGSSFQGVQRLWLGKEEALGELRLPPALAPEAEAYQQHPALLDAALQVLLALRPEREETLTTRYPTVPVRLDGFSVFRPSETPRWSHALIKEAAPDATWFEGDVRLLDDAGQTVAAVTGLRLQRLDTIAQRSDADAFRELFYEWTWQPQPLPAGKESSSPVPLTDLREQWIIFVEQGELGRDVDARFAERGASCLLVTPGEEFHRAEDNRYQLRPGNKEDLRRLLEEACHSEHVPLRGILHLWSMDAAEETGAAALASAQLLGCETVLSLLQVLAERTGHSSPQLWLGTRGAHPVGGDPHPLFVAPSLVWGLGRVVMLEHPELRCRLVDFAPSSEAGEDLLLMQELFSQSPENQLAFRAGERHVARVQRLPTERFSRVAPQPQEPLFLPDATYLITGGLGVLGLLLAQWMVEHGARHLVLVGRRGASAEADETLNRMREAGAEIVVRQADVAEEAPVAEMLDDLRRTMPPLRGVIHAAMQIEDGVLLQMNRERFRAAVRPKANGAWNLHTHTAETPLDFFVLFSSAASLFGSIGQGNYVAGNAFLDALAHYRRTLGLPALTINWGQWAESHLTTRPGLTERLALLGMDPLPPERGFAALAWLLQQEVTQAVVMSVQWQKVGASLPADAYPPLLAEVLPANIAEGKIETAQEAGADRVVFFSLPADERAAWLVTHVQHLVAQVLRHPPSEVSVEQPLNLIGGLDSLMAIEIKNRLETGLEIELPLVRLLEGPTIVEFAEIIGEELRGTPAQDEDATLAEVLEQVKHLSEEEVQRLLEQERNVE